MSRDCPCGYKVCLDQSLRNRSLQMSASQLSEMSLTFHATEKETIKCLRELWEPWFLKTLNFVV